MSKITLDEVYGFIDEHKPQFSNHMDGQLIMFTTVTQHIKGSSAKELIESGIAFSKKLNGRGFFEYLYDESHGIGK